MASKVDFSSMSLEEIATLVSQANAAKRDRKAKKERELVKATFAPLFDAIDKAITSDPALKELIEEKDAIRIYFTDKQAVDRDAYNSYSQREYNGNNGGQKQYKLKGADATKWGNVPNTTWKSACVKLNIPVKAQSAQAALNTKGYDTRVLDDEGKVTSEGKGK